MLFIEWSPSSIEYNLLQIDNNHVYVYHLWTEQIELYMWTSNIHVQEKSEDPLKKDYY